jgi:curli biogenesis system outer membrane secretion channel CsgG
MRRLITSLLVLMVLIGCAAPTVFIKPDFDSTRIRKIAILPLESPDKTISSVATDIFTAEFITLGKFEVVERSQLDKIIEEQKLGAAGTLDPATIKEVGRILGADALVIGSVYPNYRYEEIAFAPLPAKEIENINLNVRLIEVETGSVLWSGSQNSNNVFFAAPISVNEHIRVVSKDIIKAFRKILVGR